MLLDPEVAASALTVPDVSAPFVSWVSAQCLHISQKKNRMALHNYLLLRSSGASHSALSHVKNAFG